MLVQVALAMRRSIRAVDTPARIGGDEFCVLAPDQNAEAARPAWRSGWPQAVAGETAGAAGEAGRRRSRSAWSPAPSTATTPRPLLESADQAMYRAKAGGEPVAVGEPKEPEIKASKTRK